MYNRFFGFKERPFKLVPNPAFLYLSRIHEEVLAHLNYALFYGEGFVEVTGEVGTGKTTLCRKFLESLDEDTEAAYIFNPKLDVLQLLKTINDEFGIASDAESIKTLIDRLNAFLLEKKAQGKRVILMVDEAQNLSADVLEQLRLLSNLETTTSKLLQIILVGQPELGALLETDALRQLNQRITLSCHLVPLSFSETREYIRHRIHIASNKPGLLFDPAAYRTIFKYTGGTPRLINIACDRALLSAYSQGKHRITNRIVKRAIRELDEKQSRRTAPIVSKKLIPGVLAILVLILSGWYVGQTWNRRPDGRSAGPAPSKAKEQPALPSRVIIPAEAASEPAPHDSKPEPLQTFQSSAVEPLTALAPLPTLVAKDVPPAPLPPIPDIEQLIVAKGASTSRRGALSAILEKWRAPPPFGAEPMDGMDSDTFFRIAAQHCDMESLRIKGNLTKLKKLNLPAILEFPIADGSALGYLAAVGLTGTEIRLSNGEDTFFVALASLSDRWNGVAYILWKNYFNYTGIIPTSSSGEAVISLKMHLKNLGFPMREVSAAYNTATRLAVEAVQARNGLVVDGKVGPMTKIALYNEDQSLNIPRLADIPGG